MGKAFSLISKPFRNYNIESRAHKIISMEKPIAAPKHKPQAADYERILKENPNLLKDEKNKVLDKHLKDVYVLSRDPQIIEKSKKGTENPERPLPSDRTVVEDFEYGFKESKKVPVGKCTLRQVLKFITDHQIDPKLNSAEKIADEYLLSEERVRNILKYFRVYEVYIPDQKKLKGQFAGPSVPRTKITTAYRKQLGPGKPMKDNT